VGEEDALEGGDISSRPTSGHASISFSMFISGSATSSPHKLIKSASSLVRVQPIEEREARRRTS
jgi:hypothetical protein